MFSFHSEGEARLKFNRNSKHLKIIINNGDSNKFIIHIIHKILFKITHQGTQSRKNVCLKYTVIST